MAPGCIHQHHACMQAGGSQDQQACACIDRHASIGAQLIGAAPGMHAGRGATASVLGPPTPKY
jgi:hypothetical protein